MIPQNHIIEWKLKAPWPDNAQVEQDLILSRAIVAIYSNPALKDELLFRGDTVLKIKPKKNISFFLHIF